MAYTSIYEQSTVDELISRLDKIKADQVPLWGKMNASQMLAHLCVGYEGAYTENPKRPPFLMRILLRLLVKPMVTGNKPYKKGSPTGKEFIIADERDFEKEKARLIDFIKQSAQDGPTYFEGRENPNFGVLTAKEWSTVLYKHADHHFRQFGV